MMEELDAVDLAGSYYMSFVERFKKGKGQGKAKGKGKGPFSSKGKGKKGASGKPTPGVFGVYGSNQEHRQALQAACAGRGYATLYVNQNKFGGSGASDDTP